MQCRQCKQCRQSGGRRGEDPEQSSRRGSGGNNSRGVSDQRSVSETERLTQVTETRSLTQIEGDNLTRSSERDWLTHSNWEWLRSREVGPQVPGRSCHLHCSTMERERSVGIEIFPLKFGTQHKSLSWHLVLLAQSREYVMQRRLREAPLWKVPSVLSVWREGERGV